MNNYYAALLRIPKLALASCIFTLLLKFATYIIEKHVGHATAFGDAVKLLIHYPESLSAVFAFLLAVLFFLSLTLIIEPSNLGRLSRRWVFIPSLHLTEHMLSLVMGVFFSSFVIQLISMFFSGTIDKSVINTTVIVFKVIFVTGMFAAICAVTAEFLSNQFDGAMRFLGRWRFAVLLFIASTLIWAVFQDAVWNYKPEALIH
jgi:hypothetical protein